jgi:glycerophosphoryl diester phosphodiesterase
MTNFKKYIYHKRKELSIICHRGLWVKEKYPENSISAIQNAVDSNFPIVEIDVRKNMTNDFFLMHDEDLIRTTNISGKISSISSNEIKNAFFKKRKWRKKYTFK